jgi:hypothetical protein
VLRFQQRQTAEQEIQWLRKKKPWMQFETARLKAVQRKQRLGEFAKKCVLARLRYISNHIAALSI